MPDNPPAKVFLSRRNLLTLLSKLDRQKEGDLTFCTIVKVQNSHEMYQQTMKRIAVIAVEDEDYYTTLQRGAGAMHPADELNLPDSTIPIQSGNG